MKKAHIRRHPASQYWQAQFYVWDKARGAWGRIMKSTFCSNKARAQVIAEEYQALALQAYGQDASTSLTRERVLAVVNHILRLGGRTEVAETRRWDEYSQEWLSLQASRITARSLESYEGHIRSLTRWMATDAAAPLNSFTGDLLQQWYVDMLEEGRKPATVNNATKAIQAVFDRAVAEGFCPRNPVELILRQYGEKDIREPFTLDDIARVIAHLSQTTSTLDWLTVVLLGICTGQRLQDCATASREQFDKQGAQLVWKLAQGKTGKVVHVPIVEPLASHLKQTGKARPTGLLAPSLAGVPSGSPIGLSMQFSDILDEAGVVRERRAKIEGSKGRGWTDKTFHSFRHTTNSLLANAGVGDDVRRSILGHTTTKMNVIYTHMQISTLSEALKKALGGVNSK